MYKKDYTKSDSRAFNLSLIASLFTVFLITVVDIFIEIVNAYGGGITPFLAKVAIAIVACLFLLHQWKEWYTKQRKR